MDLLVKAVWSLVPEAQFGYKGSNVDSIDWSDSRPMPSKADIVAAMESIDTATGYIDKRLNEYPTIAELTIALYDTDDKAALEKRRSDVKAKYPKPS